MPRVVVLVRNRWCSATEWSMKKQRLIKITDITDQKHKLNVCVSILAGKLNNGIKWRAIGLETLQWLPWQIEHDADDSNAEQARKDCFTSKDIRIKLRREKKKWRDAGDWDRWARARKECQVRIEYWNHVNEKSNFHEESHERWASKNVC